MEEKLTREFNLLYDYMIGYKNEKYILIPYDNTEYQSNWKKKDIIEKIDKKIVLVIKKLETLKYISLEPYDFGALQIPVNDDNTITYKESKYNNTLSNTAAKFLKITLTKTGEEKFNLERKNLDSTINNEIFNQINRFFFSNNLIEK